MNLAVGFFDGLHLGHRRILERADVALTFTAHPARVLAPERAPALLMTREERMAELHGHVSQVVALDFTTELAMQPPDDFVRWLADRFPDLDTVFCGPNWNFGAGGMGNADTLRRSGMRVETVPFVEWEGSAISSTRIRQAISSGDFVAAANMLGRRWMVKGKVAQGKGLGHAIGFPTLNIVWPECLVRPPCGAMAAETRFGRAVANFGFAPTAGRDAWREPVLEVHLLDGPPPSGLDELQVEFRKFIRPERKFPDADALRVQIAADVEEAKLTFGA